MTRKSRQRRPYSFADYRVTLRLEGSKPIRLCPLLKHHTRVYQQEFHDVGSLGYWGIEHRLDAFIDRATPGSKLDWSRIEPLDLPVRTEHGPYERAITNDGLLIASIELSEIPRHMMEDFTAVWDGLPGALEFGGGLLGKALAELDRASDDDTTRSRRNGSIFVLRMPSVHPAFAGQRLGARLLAQALWFHGRHDDDAAFMLVHPDGGIFDREPMQWTAIGMRRLVGYYESIGFTRWDSGTAIEDGIPQLMYALGCATRLNMAPSRVLGAVRRSGRKLRSTTLEL